MGRDRIAGCELVQSSGGDVLAQHADGCTVDGMPGSYGALEILDKQIDPAVLVIADSLSLMVSAREGEF